MDFLERESRRENKRGRAFFVSALLLFLLLSAFILFMTRNETIDVNDYETKKLMMIGIILTAIMLVSVVFGFIRSCIGAKNGGNLKLPFKEKTKEEVAAIINQEAAEGKILVEEFIYSFSEGKKPYGEKVVLLPSYLLICRGMGNVLAIPREKIYWICAQTGRKGSSSFVVRLLIFTEKTTYEVAGVDVQHVENIADKIYQYMPNIFSEYDTFMFPYELERLFFKNRKEFMNLYEEAKKNYHQK